MKDRPIPVKLKVQEAVATRQQIEGLLPVSRLARLREALSGEAGSLAVSLRFDEQPRAIGRVTGHIEGRLPLTCQRSLEVFEWPLHVQFDWTLVRDEAEEARLLDDVDPVIVEDGQLALHEAIEDEALLSLPLIPLAGVPVSRSETNAVPISHNVELDDSRPNPFAALKGKFS